MRADNLVKIIAGVMLVMVVSALIWPVQNDRRVSADAEISDDLRTLDTLVNEHYVSEGSLPFTLDDIELDGDLIKRATDNNYEYEKIVRNKFRLCAEFATDTTGGDQNGGAFPFFDSSYMYDQVNTNVHEQGRVCYEFEADDTTNNYLEQYNLDGLINDYKDSADLPFSFDDF